MDGKTLVSVILFTVGFGSLIAYADSSDIDRVICNGNETCMQEMKLGKISERIISTKEDLGMAAKSLSLMNRYDGVWPKNEESRDWYEIQMQFVCATNEKTRRIFPEMKQELEILHSSRHPGISYRASLKLQEIQYDEDITFFSTETPCNKATELCHKFL